MRLDVFNRLTWAIVVIIFASLSKSYVHHAHVPERRHLKVVFWMHIQKTSSWMGNFLLLWGCSSLREIYEMAFKRNSMLYAALSDRLGSFDCETSYVTGGFGIGYHVPYNLQKIPNGTVITLFRRPADRIISMFLHGKGIHQIMFPIGFPERIKRKFALRRNITASQYPIYTYASLPGISGCQTKMLLGIDCGVDMRLTTKHMDEALRRLHYDTAFFGLTEESEASASLFKAMFTPNVVSGEHNARNLSSLPDTFKMLPRKNEVHTEELNAKLRAMLEESKWKDEYDELLYAEARRIFFDRCKNYGIPTRYSLVS